MTDFGYYERMDIMNIDTIWNICSFIVSFFEFCVIAMLITGLLGAMLGEDIEGIRIFGTLWRILFKFEPDDDEVYDYD